MLLQVLLCLPLGQGATAGSAAGVVLPCFQFATGAFLLFCALETGCRCISIGYWRSMLGCNGF